ncbi:MAG: hypothetical protein MUC97_15135, partial [Bernardetiaceae bacterium]|nr:hypothetical protein [Bernardetiaceae bacterium]
MIKQPSLTGHFLADASAFTSLICQTLEPIAKNSATTGHDFLIEVFFISLFVLDYVQQKSPPPF